MSTEHLLPGYLAARDRLLARRERLIIALAEIEYWREEEDPGDGFPKLHSYFQKLQVRKLEKVMQRVDRRLEGNFL